MERKGNKELYFHARKMRKEMTKEERHLWYDFLKDHKCRFQRQKVLGWYIADFYCASHKIAIEIDGSQHYEKEELQYDKARADYLSGYDIKILRFTNLDINTNFSGVCDYINKLLNEG